MIFITAESYDVLTSQYWSVLVGIIKLIIPSELIDLLGRSRKSLDLVRAASLSDSKAWRNSKSSFETLSMLLRTPVGPFAVG